MSDPAEIDEEIHPFARLYRIRGTAWVMRTQPRRTCRSCGNEFSGSVEFCPSACFARLSPAGLNPASSPLAIHSRQHRKTKRADLSIMNWCGPKMGHRSNWVAVQMGVTYKAFDVDLRCPVAVKVISERYLGDESARLRFLREARAAARLRHSNVASVLHLGRTGQNYFYAMEFVEGKTLENLIKRSGRLEVKLALEIATQVAAGLAAVHNALQKGKGSGSNSTCRACRTFFSPFVKRPLLKR